jgi:hypothetical protein
MSQRAAGDQPAAPNSRRLSPPREARAAARSEQTLAHTLPRQVFVTQTWPARHSLLLEHELHAPAQEFRTHALPASAVLAHTQPEPLPQLCTLLQTLATGQPHVPDPVPAPSTVIVHFPLAPQSAFVQH